MVSLTSPRRRADDAAGFAGCERRRLLRQGMAPDSVEAFISSVRKYPILYDCKRLGYRDVDRKREVWELVKQETGMDTGMPA